MSVRATIARNTVFNFLGRACEGVFGLTLTWYALQKLGAEGWGIWSLVAVFTGYAGLFDFGIGSGFAKYIAQHEARGERNRISALVSTGLAFYAVLGIAAIALVWLLADVLINHVVLPWAHESGLAADKVEDIRFLCRGAVVLFALNNCIAPFANIPVGLQRMGVNNAISVGVTAIKFFAALSFLHWGWGVRGLFAAQALSVVLLGLCCVAAAFRLLPSLRVGPSHLSRSMFRQLFAFGWRTQVAKLANLLDFQTDRMIVAAVYRFGDLGLVGLYGIGEYLATKMRQIPTLLVSALIPAASALDAQDRGDHLAKLYLHSTKYIAAVAFPMSAYMICNADLLLHAWLGEVEGLNRAGGVLRILCAGYLFNLLPGPGMSIILGKGLAATPMYAGLLSMTVNIVASTSLFYVVGFYGIPAGTSLGMLVATSWFFLHARQHINVPLPQLVYRAMLWPAIACLPGAVACLCIAQALRGNTDQLPNLLAAGAGGAVFGMTYLLVLRLAPFLDDFDRAFLLGTLRIGRIPGATMLVGGARQ